MSTFMKRSPKRLSVIDLEVSSRFEKLSILERLKVVAGWDCILNSYSSYLSSLGYNITASTLAQQYSAHSGIPVYYMQQSGGIEYSSFSSFTTSVYQISMSQVTSSISSFTDAHTVHIASNDGGPGHNVRPLDAYSYGGVTYINYYDPSTGQNGSCQWSQVDAVFEFEQTDLYGLQGYFGWEGGWDGYYLGNGSYTGDQGGSGNSGDDDEDYDYFDYYGEYGYGY